MKPQQTPDSRKSIRQKRTYINTETERLFQEMERKQRREGKQKKNKVGELSEEKANLALDNLEWKLEELITFQHVAIEKNSAKDYRAIDHILIFEWPENEKIEFQIKNSETGAEEHRKLHPYIPVVVIHVSREEIERGAFSDLDDAEKEVLDKLFKEYFLRNYGQEHYNAFLKEAYKE